MTTYSTNLNLKNTDLGILILRLAAGGLMLTHGLPKLNKLFAGGELVFADPMGVGVELSLTLAVFAEIICATLIIIGLGTRLAAIPLIITMFIAAFIFHGADSFNAKELSLFYLLVYIVLAIIGSGKYSLDYYFIKRKDKK